MKSDEKNQLIERWTKELTGCTKQQAAKEIHELLTKSGEKDEADVRAAVVLKDLYDCHACVNHVAQVYVKGIMESSRTDVFGMQERLSGGEAYLAARRIWDRRYRKHVQKYDDRDAGPRPLNGEELAKLGADYLIDVRSPGEYAGGHLDNAISVPLENYYRNPYSVTSRIDAKLVMICAQGVKSRLAAELAYRAGFTNVFYMRMQP